MTTPTAEYLLERKLLSKIIDHPFQKLSDVSGLLQELRFTFHLHEEIRKKLLSLNYFGVNNLRAVLLEECQRFTFSFELTNEIREVLEADVKALHLNYLLHRFKIDKFKSRLEDTLDKINKGIGEDEQSLMELVMTVRREWDVYPLIESGFKFIHPAECIRNLIKQPELLPTLPSGINNLDSQINGFSKGELCVIGCRPAMGATTLLINMLIETCLNKNIPSAFISLKKSANQWSTHFFKVLSSFDLVTDFSADDLLVLSRTPLFESYFKKMEEAPLFFTDHRCKQMHVLESEIRALHANHKVELFFIDTLQELSLNRQFRGSHEQEIALITAKLKSLSIELNIAIVVTSRLSRAVESRGGMKRPNLSDLRESGAIEQDADKVLFIYRPEYYGISHDEFGDSTVGRMELIVAKNSTGKLADVLVYFDVDTLKITSEPPGITNDNEIDFTSIRKEEFKMNQKK
jgi:replicative DNA helicase